MILQDTIEIIASQRNLKILRPIFGYDIEMNRIYLVPIEKLSKGSHYKIKVKCDFCDFTREIIYKQYINNIEKDGKYYCSCCSIEKMKKSKFEKYGEEYYNGFDKYKETMKMLYGVENGFQLEDVKKKSKETKLERYGDENYTNLEKHKDTIMRLYSVDNVSKSEEIKRKKKQTCMINYGVLYPIQNKEILKKYNKVIKEKYGVDHISHSEDIKNKHLFKKIWCRICSSK